jgi:Leucine-rich repeat (LRR) protein
LKNLVITSPNEEITSVNGEPMIFALNTIVKILNLDKEIVEYFPKGLEKFVPNIEELSMTDVQLKEIAKSDLQLFPMLKILFLDYNNIEELDENLFERNKELIHLYLDHNRIKFIHGNTFAPLKKLETLYLGSNKCIAKNVYKKKEVKEIIKEIKINCVDGTKLEILKNAGNQVSKPFLMSLLSLILICHCLLVV